MSLNANTIAALSMGLVVPAGGVAEDYTDPGVANVRENTSYLYAGETLTGTMLPASTISGNQFERTLTQTCIIRRNSPGEQDAHGQAAESWGDLATGVKCKIITTGGKELQKDDMVVVAEYKLMLLASQDVTERDRIVIDSVTYEILLCEMKYQRGLAHHKELSLRAIR